MANIPRILAVGVGGGPLDGQYFSVAEDQQTVEGINNMSEEEIYTRDEDTRRKLEGHETALTKLLFDPKVHDLTEVVEFRYGTSA